MRTASKVCAQCGNEFFKAIDVSAIRWEKRRFCSKKCRQDASNINKEKHKFDGRYPDKYCDCGQVATGKIWVYQLAGDGTPTRQYINVCEDCRQMYLEEDPGAMAEMPERPVWDDWYPKHNEGQYSHQAHWYRDIWRAHG